MPRKYQMRRRAERQAATRRRIVDAAIELHQAIGPAATTVTDVAARAGVSRQTVYRHFPDDLSLFVACTSTYAIEHPPPDPSDLLAMAEPVARIRAALHRLYAYYAANEPMFGGAEDALATTPALAAALGPREVGLARLADMLASGLVPGSTTRSLVRPAIAHALSFRTWRSLHVEEGLTLEEAVRLMTAMVQAAAELAQ
jgi:AcrR family transcriptional regulator